MITREYFIDLYKRRMDDQREQSKYEDFDESWASHGYADAYEEIISDLRKVENLYNYAHKLDEIGKDGQAYANTIEGEMHIYEMAKSCTMRNVANEILKNLRTEIK